MHKIFPHHRPVEIAPALWEVTGSLPFPLKRKMVSRRAAGRPCGRVVLGAHSDPVTTGASAFLRESADGIWRAPATSTTAFVNDDYTSPPVLARCGDGGLGVRMRSVPRSRRAARMPLDQIDSYSVQFSQGAGMMTSSAPRASR